MKLIRKLGTRRNKSGNLISYGIFWCDFCLQEVEKQLSSGKVCKSCGCERYTLSSEAQKGKIISEKQKQRLREVNIGKVSSFKGKTHTEEAKKKNSESHKGKKVSEKQKEQHSERMKGKNNPMYGKSGELSPNWQGGISFEIYTKEFSQIKKFILERDNYTCQCPDCEHKSIKLHVHHIDYNKQNNNSENLTILCHSCYSKTVGKKDRIYWVKFYQNIMMNRIMNCLL